MTHRKWDDDPEPFIPFMTILLAIGFILFI